jgi:hypothetical protein
MKKIDEYYKVADTVDNITLTEEEVESFDWTEELHKEEAGEEHIQHVIRAILKQAIIENVHELNFEQVEEGLKVVFNNSLPAYSAASANGVYAIVGDFNNGALLNFPNGEGTEMKYDDKTVMEYDLVRILGRRYIGMNAVADKAFVLIAKPSVSA